MTTLAIWDKVRRDDSSIWAELLEGNYVEGWHVWKVEYTDEQGNHWCVRCQDYHEMPTEYNPTTT